MIHNCDRCGQQFKWDKHYQNHLKNKHKNTIMTEELFNIMSVNEITEKVEGDEKSSQGNFPAIGSGIKYYSELSKFISHDGLKFDPEKYPTIDKMGKLLRIKIDNVGACSFNDRENNPLRLKKDGKPHKIQKEIIDGEEYEGVLVNFKGLTDELWEKKNTEGIYFITFNDHIVKIGMTENHFSKRFDSYCCGARRHMKKGTPSTTNFIICEVLYTALQLGLNVDIYGIQIPKEKKEIEVYGQKNLCPISVVRAHEEIITNIYKTNIGEIPPLCVQHASNTLL